jgi:hypothetical protein
VPGVTHVSVYCEVIVALHHIMLPAVIMVVPVWIIMNIKLRLVSLSLISCRLQRLYSCYSLVILCIRFVYLYVMRFLGSPGFRKEHIVLYITIYKYINRFN